MIFMCINKYLHIMESQSKNKHLIIRINETVKDSYKQFCDENGYTVSKRILSLLKKDMNNEI